jgi:hypothetical protein
MVVTAGWLGIFIKACHSSVEQNVTISKPPGVKAACDTVVKDLENMTCERSHSK